VVPVELRAELLVERGGDLDLRRAVLAAGLDQQTLGDERVGVLDHAADLVPVGVGEIESQPDPAAGPHVGRDEEPLGSVVDQRRLQLLRRGRPEAEAALEPLALVVDGGERPPLAAVGGEERRRPVRELLDDTGDGQRHRPDPLGRGLEAGGADNRMGHRWSVSSIGREERNRLGG
jgi:hypothetical protein